MRQLFLFSVLFLSLTARAQDSTIFYNYHHAVKLDLGALADPDRTIQAGVEFPIGGRTSWQIMAGYGWQRLQGSELGSFSAAEVWRVRNEVRFYTGHFRTNAYRNIAIKATAPLGNYWGFELLAKQINITERQNLLPGTTIYVGSAISPKQRYILGTHLKIGRQFAIPYTRKTLSRVLIDMYIGAGIRYAIVHEQGEHSAADELHPGMFRNRFDPGNRFVPSLTAGLKMGFAL